MLSFAPRRPGSSGTGPARRTPTIIVVDSQPTDYQGWNAAAETSGARLQFVASAEEALRLSRTTAVDLWVVSAELPGLSGYELCGMLKAQSASTAVYLVADEVSPTAEPRAWQARATLFSYKPAHHALLDLWIEQRRSRHGRLEPPTRSPAHVQTT